MTRRPLGRVNCSKAICPACCAASVAGSSESRASSLRMGPRLHRKKRQPVGFENGLLLFGRERQAKELPVVFQQVLNPGARPVRAPSKAAPNLPQAGKEPD